MWEVEMGMRKLTSIEEMLLIKLETYHKGKRKSITSSKLRHIANARDIRVTVHKLRVKGYPICSWRKGYYYAENSSELYGTLKFLEGYLSNIEKAHQGVREAYREMVIQEEQDKSMRER